MSTPPGAEHADSRRRRLRLGLAAVLIVVIGAAAVAATGRDDTGLAAARLELATGPYATRVEAAETLARVTAHLHDELRRCREGEAPVARCPAVGAAAGYSQVLAARLLACSAPARHSARERLSAYLARVEAIGTGDERPPEPPGLPACHQ